MDSLNVLMGQSFTHMAGDEDQAKKIVEDYRSKHDIKKSSIQRKTKKGQEYFVVRVEIVFVAEKEAFEMSFGE